MKYQNKLKEIQEAGFYKVPNVFFKVALDADKEIEDLKYLEKQLRLKVEVEADLRKRLEQRYKNA